MIVLIDNYDSFTFNLFHYLGGLGAEVVVHRNDKITADAVVAAEPDAIVLSPGPCTPERRRHLPRPHRARRRRTIPIFGVCLGHQAIGQVFRRQGRARAGAGAWQAVADQAPGRRRVPRHQRTVPGNALSFAGRRARQHAGELAVDGGDRRPAGDGPRAYKACRCMACSFIPKASRPSTAISFCGISSTSRRRGTPRTAGARVRQAPANARAAH